MLVKDAFFTSLIILCCIIYVLSIISVASKKKQRGRQISSDGHVVQKSQDFTCETNYGHEHDAPQESFERRYIVHEDPEEGYVVLNGIKRKLEDCAKL